MGQARGAKALKLAIATTTYFSTYDHVKDKWYRLQLWPKFVKSLKDSIIGDNELILVVSDDASTIKPRADFPFETIFRHRAKHVGWNENTIEAVNLAAILADYVISVDSDGYFAPDWLEWLLNAINDYPSASYSLFNSPRHKSVIEELPLDRLAKSTSPNHGICFKSTNRPIQDAGKWCEEYITNLPKPFITPKISKLQHLGCYGINNLPGHSQDYDPLFPFNAECGLKGYTDRSGFDD